MSEEIEDLTSLKYIRVGYYPNGTFCDTVVQLLTQNIPGNGDILPPRWRHINAEIFTNKYNALGPKWSKTASYHLLLISGQHVLRVWTDAKHVCLVDLASVLTDADCTPIPEKNWRKCKPFTMRKRIQTVEQATDLAQKVKRIYGI